MMVGIGIALILVFIGYTILTDKVVGTTFSYSNSWFAWKTIKKEWVFVLFLLAISLGLLLIVETAQWNKSEVEWRNNWAPWLFVVGAIANMGIGAFANFKKSWRDSMWHNIFSVATFACVLMGLLFQEIKFPLMCFAVIASAFAPIKLPNRTTVIEGVGIGLSCVGVFGL